MTAIQSRHTETDLLFRSPVVDVVVRVFLVIEKLIKQFPQVVVVRSFEEVQSPDVAQVSGELLRVALAQDFDRGRAFRVPDLLVAFFQSLGFQPLPGDRSEEGGRRAGTYQGRLPLKKYINMWPMASKSSRRDCSFPKWVLMLMYRAVPVRLLCSR